MPPIAIPGQGDAPEAAVAQTEFFLEAGQAVGQQHQVRTIHQQAEEAEYKNDYPDVVLGHRVNGGLRGGVHNLIR